MRRFVKKLVHPDGGDFVVWHPVLPVYCPVQCDEDCPPDPEWMDFDIEPEARRSNLRWQLTGETYENGEV